VRVISSSSSAVISNAVNTTINVPKFEYHNWCELANNRTVLSNAILPFKMSKLNLFSFIEVITVKLVTLCQQLNTEQTCSPDLCMYQSVHIALVLQFRITGYQRAE